MDRRHSVILARWPWRLRRVARCRRRRAGAARPSPKPWTLPRTPDGKPDLQGNWTNATLTPLERPGDNTPLSMPKEEVARLEKGVPRSRRSARAGRAIRIGRRRPRAATDRPAPPATSAATTTSGSIPGDAIAVVNGEYRSSLIVDPPNGKVPAHDAGSPQAQRRRAWRRCKGRGQYDHPELRPLAERCLMSFGSNAGPPMLPNYFYNNNYQFVQTKDTLMILVEMVHDVRVIRIGGEPQHPPKHIRPWMGDSIGRWEGDTLVVETTNFHPLQVFRGASDNLKVIERFTRADADTILYKFTIDDPTTFTGRGAARFPSSGPTS